MDGNRVHKLLCDELWVFKAKFRLIYRKSDMTSSYKFNLIFYVLHEDYIQSEATSRSPQHR